MILEIDYREKSLIEKLNDKQTIFQTSNLLIGDIHITTKKGETQDSVPLLIIERKTLSDLAASIIDRRYTEQSYRLSVSEVHNHNIIYLIEGNIETFKSRTRITRDVLENAIISLGFGKGFTVVRTADVQDSANYITRLFNKVSKTNKFSFYYSCSNTLKSDTKAITEPDNSSTPVEQETDNVRETSSLVGECYLNTLKVSKKDNITLANIQPLMLSQIPGVSVTVAKTIIEKYETIDKLISCVRENKEEFKSLKMKDNTGKERRINKTALDNICCYLKI